MYTIRIYDPEFDIVTLIHEYDRNDADEIAMRARAQGLKARVIPPRRNMDNCQRQ
jgi:hypothetical protein